MKFHPTFLAFSLHLPCNCRVLYYYVYTYLVDNGASTGGLGGGSVEIDDKLFKEMNVKNIGGDNNSLFDM